MQQFSPRNVYATPAGIASPLLGRARRQLEANTYNLQQFGRLVNTRRK
jgi:hypothetical protein